MENSDAVEQPKPSRAQVLAGAANAAMSGMNALHEATMSLFHEPRRSLRKRLETRRLRTGIKRSRVPHA